MTRSKDERPTLQDADAVDGVTYLISAVEQAVETNPAEADRVMAELLHSHPHDLRVRELLERVKDRLLQGRKAPE
jgi:hypothetical protein